jgi:ankyrin repeat protein
MPGKIEIRKKFLSALACLALAALPQMAALKITPHAFAENRNAMSGADFLDLCEKGSLEDIQAAIYGGADVNVRGGEGRTPLSLAASSGSDPEVITALVKAGADVSSLSAINWTPLRWAAWDNDNPGVITALAKAGANANERDAGDVTPLMIAVRVNGNPAITAALISAGANVNERDINGRTPLMWAAAYDEDESETDSRGEPRKLYGKSDRIMVLLNAGADIMAVDRDGLRAADYAKNNEKLAGTEALQKLFAQDTSPDIAEPAPESAANSKTPGADEEFAAFLQKFSEDENFQRKFTRDPMAFTDIDREHRDFKIMIWHQNRHEIRFPVMPLARERERWQLEMSGSVIKGNEAQAVLRVPDTGYVVMYYFRKDNGWVLERKEDWSM